MSKGRASSPTRVSEVVLEACSGYETVIFNTCAILAVVISVIISAITLADFRLTVAAAPFEHQPGEQRNIVTYPDGLLTMWAVRTR